jgi:hypothetical protein
VFMYRIVAFLLILVPFWANSQTPVITLTPTPKTEGWVFFEDSTKKVLSRLDSLAMAQEFSKRTLKTDSVWIYRNAKTYRLIFNIEIDTINNARAYLVSYNESFAKMDIEMYKLFGNLSYYQNTPLIAPMQTVKSYHQDTSALISNPYSQGRYLNKSGNYLMAAGAFGLLEIAASILRVEKPDKTGKAISFGLSLTSLAAIPLFFISASNLKKAGHTRFR